MDNFDRPIDVLGLGAPIVDHIVYVSEEDIAKLKGKKGGMETVDRKTFSELLRHTENGSKIIPGGCCSNTVRALARLGRRCSLIGKIGEDDIGKLLLEELKKLRVIPHYSTTSTPTAQVISFVTPDGERTCRSYLGACLEMNANGLDPKAFRNVNLVHIEGYTLLYPGLTKKTMEYAKQAGALISFDLANFEVIKHHYHELMELLRKYVTICLCNEEEAKALTSRPTVEEGCLALQKLCDIAVVHAGKKGAWAGFSDTLAFSPAIHVEHVKDTTAAGDMFAAGFLHGYLAEEPLETSLKYGNLLGAATVQVQGSQLSEEQWTELHKQIPA